MMCEVPVFYASTEGQTRRIAERLAVWLRERGLDSEAVDMSGPQARRIDWTGVRGVLLGASLHGGRHQRAADAFVRRHRDALNARPSAFFSVSLSAASSHPEEVATAAKIAQDFVEAAGWRPNQVLPVAGRLAYSQYGLLKRWLMKRIARKEGGPTDTSRDHELTRWDEVRVLARDMSGRILSRPTPPGSVERPPQAAPALHGAR
jgi:menaquinone-dependent protoporphyrinogen oxidase